MTDGKTLIDTVDSDTFTGDPGAGIECGKLDAPDRIWARPEHDDENSYGGFWIKEPVEAGATEYIRADLPQATVEALEAKLAKAVELGSELADCVEYGQMGERAMTGVEAWDAFTAELTGGKDG